ncbi:MAG: DUF5329 family protein [Leptospira sp.]|nr:DUF5329 family protein [Leptospira sp.]
MIKQIVYPTLFLFLISHNLLFSKGTICEPKSETKKIEILLEKIGNLDAKFQRNGSMYSAKEAEKHLRFKLEEAKKSFFAPDPKEWTAILFIEKIGSKSFLTGTPYKIIFPNRFEINASEWLKLELKKIESCE